MRPVVVAFVTLFAISIILGHGRATADAAGNESWSLGDLGLASPVTLSADNPTFEVGLSLPPGLRQGESRWVSASVRVDIGGLKSLQGIGYVEGHWNDQAFLGLKLKPLRASLGSVVEWSATDLLNGSLRGYETGDRAVFTLSNFPPLRAVNGGANQLKLSLAGSAGPGVRVTIEPSSRIYVTAKGPPTLRFTEGSWWMSGTKAGVSVMAASEQLPPKWVELHVRFVLSGGGHLDRWSYFEPPSNSVMSLDAAWDVPNEDIQDVQVNAEFPGGGTGPVVIARRQSWVSWRSLNDAIPWAAVVVLVFPVFWLAASNVLARRDSVASLFGALCMATVGFSLAAGSGAVADVNPPLEFLPAVSGSERLAVSSEVAEWLVDRFQSKVDLRRAQVWLMREDGAAIGYVINVGMTADAAQCSGSAPQSSVELVSGRIWVLHTCG